MEDKTSLAYDLQSQVRLDKAKEQAIFDHIHILEDHEHYSSDAIVDFLVGDIFCKTEQKAWQWLRRYKEAQMLDSEKSYLAEQAQLSGELDAINRKLAMMSNKSQACPRPYFFE